ncbi:MAG: DUF3035 domain-containing protein [Parvularculaceae bacterium]|nr:DUF3035 domain-containing protein [Parvularculaceae bacterium]
MRSLFILTVGALALTACASGDPVANRNAPDEFSILTKPPLTVPPDYALKPPRPGETRPEELSTSQRTEQLILGDREYEPPTNGELALIQAAGAVDVDPSIRAILAAENGGRVDKDDSLSNRLILWRFKGEQVDDSAAALVVEDREGWMNSRRDSIERVTGPGAEVIIESDDRNVLALPGIN